MINFLFLFPLPPPLSGMMMFCLSVKGSPSLVSLYFVSLTFYLIRIYFASI